MREGVGKVGHVLDHVADEAVDQAPPLFRVALHEFSKVKVRIVKRMYQAADRVYAVPKCRFERAKSG